MKMYNCILLSVLFAFLLLANSFGYQQHSEKLVTCHRVFCRRTFFGQVAKVANAGMASVFIASADDGSNHNNIARSDNAKTDKQRLSEEKEAEKRRKEAEKEARRVAEETKKRLAVGRIGII